jgi:hypothetical protein
VTDSTTGTLPQSSALAEASPDSLTELLSRDPEHYQDQDLDRIIALLREQRVRWKAAEGAKPPRVKSGGVKLGTATTATLDDLGL